MAKLAVVLGAFLYALNALLVKKIKNIKPLQLSAAVMSVSSLQLLVLLGCIDQSIIISSVVFFDSLIAIIIMSVFSTAIATVIYYRIINNYGPNFLSLVNYPIPIFAFFAGVIFLDEVFNIYSIISLLLVIAAIYISQKY
jgi:drug/metabolite transporter (DMT)-like permease